MPSRGRRCHGDAIINQLWKLQSIIACAAGVYGPSLTNMDYVLRYQDAMGMESRDMMNALVVS
jgi:FAD/FMN-containing dehydrogenase